MSECPLHPAPIERCAHYDGQTVILQPFEGIDGLYIITKGYEPPRKGSITSPIEAARKDWAFEQMAAEIRE